MATAVRVGDFTLTAHAVMRYRDRVRPALSVADARRELARIILLGDVRPRPEWASNQDEREDFLFVGDDVAFPIADGYLLTCVTRGSISPADRERRQRKRRRRRERRVIRNRHGFHPERAELAA